MTRPVCQWCGKPAPKLTRVVWVERVGENTAPLRPPTAYARTIRLSYDLGDRADCQRHTNGHITRVFPWAGRVRRFHEWDGESWALPYGAGRFCKQPCAIAFAVAAHRSGYRRGLQR